MHSIKGLGPSSRLLPSQRSTTLRPVFSISTSQSTVRSRTHVTPRGCAHPRVRRHLCLMHYPTLFDLSINFRTSPCMQGRQLHIRHLRYMAREGKRRTSPNGLYADCDSGDNINVSEILNSQSVWCDSLNDRSYCCSTMYPPGLQYSAVQKWYRALSWPDSDEAMHTHTPVIPLYRLDMIPVSMLGMFRPGLA